MAQEKQTLRQSLVFLTVLLLCLPILTLADYNYLPEFGGDPGHSFSVEGEPPVALNPYTLPFDGGTPHHPISQDFNGDEKFEIIIEDSDDQVRMVSGEDPTISYDVIPFKQAMNGIACDIDNDNELEYVTILNATDYYLVSLGVSSNNNFVLESNTTVSAPGYYGTFVCSRFFDTEGDADLHVGWLSNDAKINFAKVTGSSWDFTVQDEEVDDSSTEQGDAVYTYPLGNHQLVVSDNFGTEEHKYAAFVAGGHVYTYRSDGALIVGELNLDLESYLSSKSYIPGSLAQVTAHAVRRPSGDTNFLFVFGGDSSTVADDQFVLVESTWGGYNIDAETGWDGIGIGIGASPGASAAMIEDITGDGVDDIISYYVGSSLFGVGMGVEVRDGRSPTFNINYTTSLGTGTTSAGAANPFLARPWLFDADDDGVKDLIYYVETGAETLWYESFVDGSSGVLITLTGHGVGESPYGWYPLYMNDDAELDILWTDGFLTKAWLSTIVSTTVKNYPYSVGLNNTVGLTGNTKIITDFWDGTSEPNYNYAMVCNIEGDVLLNENFGLDYNNTGGDVTTNSAHTLLVDGIRFDGGGAQFEGELSEGKYDFLSYKLRYEGMSSDVAYDLYFFDTDGKATLWLNLNDTGTSLQINRTSYGVLPPAIQDLGTATVSDSGSVVVEVRFEPIGEPNDGALAFELYVDGVLINDSFFSLEDDGTDIQSFLFYTGDNVSFTVNNVEVSLDPDLEPGFTQFQNGYRTEVSGVELFIPPVSSIITGDGYRVVPGENEVFYGRCDYEADGTYTQRHYIAAPNEADYTNYKDYTITVAEDVETGVVGVGAAQGTIASTGVAEEVNGFLQPIFDSLGIELSLGWKFIIWLLIMGIAAVFLYRVNVVLGTMSIPILLIAGGILGMVPTWVIIMLAILCAGIIAMFAKKIFGGD